MGNELKHLFIFAPLTGERLCAALLPNNGSEEVHAIWESLEEGVKGYYEEAAQLLSSQCSLCYKCGKQAPLQTVEEQLLCSDCAKPRILVDIKLPDVATAYYHELLIKVMDADHKSGYEIQAEIDMLDEQAERLGLRFDVEGGRVQLVPLEATDGMQAAKSTLAIAKAILKGGRDDAI